MNSEKSKASRIEERLHIINAIVWAVEHGREVIESVYAAADMQAARKALMAKFDFTQEQAQAIIDMRLRVFTEKEREKLKEEQENCKMNCRVLSSSKEIHLWC